MTTSLVEEVPGLTIKEQWETPDSRPGREGERWMNAIFRATCGISPSSDEV